MLDLCWCILLSLISLKLGFVRLPWHWSNYPDFVWKFWLIHSWCNDPACTNTEFQKIDFWFHYYFTLWLWCFHLFTMIQTYWNFALLLWNVEDAYKTLLDSKFEGFRPSFMKFLSWSFSWMIFASTCYTSCLCAITMNYVSLLILCLTMILNFCLKLSQYVTVVLRTCLAHLKCWLIACHANYATWLILDYHLSIASTVGFLLWS